MLLGVIDNVYTVNPDNVDCYYPGLLLNGVGDRMSLNALQTV